MRALLAALTLAVGLTAGEPRAVSMHPFAGQRGREFQATVRGSYLKDIKSVFVEQAGLQIAVEGPASSHDGNQKVEMDTVRIRVQSTAETKPGRYTFRMVTPEGVSNSLPVLITEAEVLAEPDGVHDTPETAVAVEGESASYVGRIAKHGETDFYAFDVRAGETMTFQVNSGLPSIGAAGGNANGAGVA